MANTSRGPKHQAKRQGSRVIWVKKMHCAAKKGFGFEAWMKKLFTSRVKVNKSLPSLLLACVDQKIKLYSSLGWCGIEPRILSGALSSTTIFLSFCPPQTVSKGGKGKQRDLNKYHQFKTRVSVSELLLARHSLYLREEILNPSVARESLGRLFAPFTSTLFTLRGKSLFNKKRKNWRSPFLQFTHYQTKFRMSEIEVIRQQRH